MIISFQVDPNDVQTYHETGTEPVEKISAIKSRDEYTALKTLLTEQGITDPILIRVEKDRTYVEVGEQRVLIAREAGVTTLSAIAYSFKEAQIPFSGTELKSIEDVMRCFPRKEFSVTERDVCPFCSHDSGEKTSTVAVPALKTLERYIEAGIAKF